MRGAAGSREKKPLTTRRRVILPYCIGDADDGDEKGFNWIWKREDEGEPRRGRGGGRGGEEREELGAWSELHQCRSSSFLKKSGNGTVIDVTGGPLE